MKMTTFGLLMGLSLCLAGADVRAQSTESDSDQRPSLAASPDVVRKTNGGMLRGTIVELEPGEKVVIQLSSGELREIRMSEVEYAGPVEEMPARTTTPSVPDAPRSSTSNIEPAVVVQTQQAQLTLRANEPELTYHIYHGSTSRPLGGNNVLVIHSFDRLCTAPCTARLAAGTYTLALSREGADPVPTKKHVTLAAGPSTLDGTYSSRKTLRVAGWITMIAGAGIMFSSLAFVNDGGAKFWAPLGVGMGVMLVGLPLTMIRDKVEIRRAE